MPHHTLPIESFLKAGTRAHLAGIGGVSMCALAEVLQGRGLTVHGSDMTDSDTVRHLRSVGIDVAIGHNADNLQDCDLVIRSAAIRDNNPEIAGAIARGIPVSERAEAWGALMREYRHSLCIAGTHGKTTTTSMATYALMAARRDPTVMIGGTLDLLGKGYRVGQGDVIVAESCEYRNSFLSFFPTVAVVLNVAADHLDFFKDLDDIKHSFRQFAERTPDDGYVVYNLDDEGAVDALAGCQKNLFGFSVKQGRGDCWAENVAFHDGCGEFDAVVRGKAYAHIALHVPGKHNVSNALAVAAAMYLLGVDGKAVGDGLAAFHGAGRRFEYKGEYHGAAVYDDYAHHPDELSALLQAAASVPHRRIICAFQPHTYTRTAALFDRFVEVLKTVEVAVVAEIYAARETNELGISSKDLCAEIPGSVYCSTLDQVTDTLARLAQPGDLILTVGAGDIFRAGEKLLARE